MIRKATINDAIAIEQLIRTYAEKGQMLFRSIEDISQNIADFLVYEKEGMILGVCALNNNWEKPTSPDEAFKSDFEYDSLVEVRSLAVHPDYFRQGIGTALLHQCMEIATESKKKKIFVLTYAISMFKKLGFEVVDKSTLPQKIWTDCRGCSKQDFCDETAMIRSLFPNPRSEKQSSGHGAEVCAHTGD